MANSLHRKVALVTGSARRIGAHFIRTLALMGYDVAIHYRTNGDLAEKLRADMERGGAVAATFRAELMEPLQCQALIADVRDHFGRLDLLVNNAAAFRHDTVHSLSEGSWGAHLNTNLRAPVFLTQAFAEAYDADEPGLVVNILDQKVNRPNADNFSYTAAKLALGSLTPLMAVALAPCVRVCGIAPGITLPSGAQTPEDHKRAASLPPMKSSSTLDDLSRALRFLIESPTITGTILTVDGGESLIGATFDRTYQPVSER